MGYRTASTSQLISLIVLVACNTSTDSNAQQKSRDVALAGYQLLVHSAKQNDPGLVTVLNVTDTTEVKLNDSIRVHYVWLDELKNLKRETNVIMLSHFGNELLYPVKSDGYIVAGVTVKEDANRWKFSGLAKIDFTSRADSLIRLQEDKGRRQPYLLKIPPLYLAFIANQTNDDIMLTCLVDNTSLNIKKNERYKASVLFRVLNDKLLSNQIKFLSPKGFVPRRKP